MEGLVHSVPVDLRVKIVLSEQNLEGPCINGRASGLVRGRKLKKFKFNIFRELYLLCMAESMPLSCRNLCRSQGRRLGKGLKR